MGEITEKKGNDTFWGIPQLLLGGMEEKNEKENEKDTQ